MKTCFWLLGHHNCDEVEPCPCAVSGGYSTETPYLGLLSMNCINEVLSKNFVPAEFEDFLLQVFQQTFYLLQKLTKESNTNSSGNRLEEIDEEWAHSDDVGDGGDDDYSDNSDGGGDDDDVVVVMMMMMMMMTVREEGGRREELKEYQSMRVSLMSIYMHQRQGSTWVYALCHKECLMSDHVLLTGTWCLWGSQVVELKLWETCHVHFRHFRIHFWWVDLV